ncbi:MAG: hypothetical protein CMM58_02440 [Rhodospirillaceae bacterium]|nr:hypothetical protein [Rhodospirillaceae bacterium]|tara:strand:+ start:909 stop:1406 length:498 start_codon:yes stop_codon:yes gene_type:complete
MSDGNQARLKFNNYAIPCCIGKSGFTDRKQEGDGCTPIGTWPLRRVFYRPDRIEEPVTPLPLVPLTEIMGWSDDPTDKENYNRLVCIPHPFSHEVLWRADNMYDIVVELGYNDGPRVLGAGSAIFLHIARPDFGATAGCIAIEKHFLLDVLKQVENPEVMIVAGS